VSVYVDNYNARFGRMVMCHLMADTHEELMSMANKIGVKRKWLQKAGTWREHFDVCLEMRAKAVKAGAVELTARELMLKMRKRPTPGNTNPRRGRSIPEAS
jgi:hypothetical protein